MRYRSTRALDDASVSFGAAMMRGMAPDGGLYVPVSTPALPSGWDDISNLADASSLANAARWALPPFMGAASAEAVAQALDFEVPVSRVGQDLVLELFHGPTSAFKDVGARSLAHLMQARLQRAGKSATILVATSGDTGSAVADAFSGLSRLQVGLLYPLGGVSRVQEEQLVAARPGVRAFAVEGTFDDCQRMVKQAFADPELSDLRLSSANSINVGRLLPQMLYYLAGVRQARRHFGVQSEITVVVPSGNLGNLAAGLMAQKIGLSGVTFVSAHNRNDYFARYLTGAAEPYGFAPSIATLSNAMDVGAPSNFERLHTMFGDDLKALVSAQVVNDEATLERMRTTYEQHRYLACPHTAVGLEAAARLASQSAGTATLVLSTAHPAKFPESVERATGVTPAAPSALVAYGAAEKRVERIGADAEQLKAALLSKPSFSG